MQSTSQTQNPLHVAIIMDGNGRWARARGLERSAGHRAGARAARRVIEAAPRLGIDILTLFAFSSENWGRPAAEVAALMELFGRFLAGEAERCRREGVRLEVIGRRDRLARALRTAIAGAEAATAGGRCLRLRVAIDYSARAAIAAAAGASSPEGAAGPDAFARRLAAAGHGEPAPDVDLLVRTGGERRLSDFLLWESAWAELHFTPCPWPDFGAADLARAVADFHRRERRFGRLPGRADAGPPQVLLLPGAAP